MDTKNNPKVTKERGVIARHFFRNWAFYLVIGALFFFSAFQYLSKVSAISKNEKAKIEFQSNLTEKAEGIVNKLTDKHLDLMMRSFTWAVRSELVRNNLDQVDQYFNNMVKSESISEINLVDNDGKILLSTNKKQEGFQIDSVYAAKALASETITSTEIEGNKVMFGPVLSLNEHAGTVILTYKKEVVALGGSE